MKKAPLKKESHAAAAARSDTKIQAVEAIAYRIPTDFPEADGTIEWQATTIVIVTVRCGDHVGMGYTYGHHALASLAEDPLRQVLVGSNALDIPALWASMRRSLRNIGVPGMGLMAIAAVDHALWDLKGRLLNRSVVDLLGQCRPSVPVYGSGGFTSYSTRQLQTQLADWVSQDIPMVKMKVGTHPAEDPARIGAAREAIGGKTRLMVDANGAYTRKQALELAERFAQENDVCWFEEPLPSDDLEGLRLLRDRSPPGMDVAAGEYGWDVEYFRRMLASGAVDTLQIDSTRCGGFTGFLQCAAVAQSFAIPISAHCAPHLHAHVCSAVPMLRHVEYFHDHVRIEAMFFDGLPALNRGALHVDRTRPGLGMELKREEIERYRIHG